MGFCNPKLLTACAYWVHKGRRDRTYKVPSPSYYYVNNSNPSLRFPPSGLQNSNNKPSIVSELSLPFSCSFLFVVYLKLIFCRPVRGMGPQFVVRASSILSCFQYYTLLGIYIDLCVLLPVAEIES